MNREQARDMLADYLGDELEPEQKRHFEAYLTADHELAAEVDALRGTLAALRSLDVPSAMGVAPDGRRLAGRRGAAALRYAAVFVFAFGAGYLANSLASGGPQSPSPAPSESWSERDFGEWESRVAAAYARHAGQSGLARSLVALAEVGQEP